jgi:hypothetical protein
VWAQVCDTATTSEQAQRQMIENYAKLGTTSEAAPGQRDNGLNGRSAASTAAAAATATATAGRPGSSKLAGGFFDQPGGGGGGKKTAAASASPGRWLLLPPKPSLCAVLFVTGISLRGA